VFQEVPPSPEELAREAGVEPGGDRVTSGGQGVVEPPPEAPEAVEPEPEVAAPEPEPEPKPEPEPVVEEPPAEPVATTEAVRHEYDAGRLVAVVIEEGGGTTRIERGADGWTVHPG
jgi:hypothetical protein